MIKELRTWAMVLALATQVHCIPVDRQPTKVAETNAPTKSVRITYGVYPVNSTNTPPIRTYEYAKGIDENADTNSIAQEGKFKLKLLPRSQEYRPIKIEVY